MHARTHADARTHARTNWKHADECITSSLPLPHRPVPVRVTYLDEVLADKLKDFGLERVLVEDLVKHKLLRADLARGRREGNNHLARTGGSRQAGSRSKQKKQARRQAGRRQQQAGSKEAGSRRRGRSGTDREGVSERMKGRQRTHGIRSQVIQSARERAQTDRLTIPPGG